MQVTELALVVAGVVTLAAFVLAGYAIHRLTSVPKKIVGVLVALTMLLGSVPAVILAFHALAAAS